MAKRVFLGDDGLLAEAVAARLLSCVPAGKVPDLSNILLTLPGKLARERVLHHLGRLAPGGVLTPQILTPSLLMRYGMEHDGMIPAVADELIWTKTVRMALRKADEFNLIFPGGKVPPDPARIAVKLRDFRIEVMRGGKMLADLEPFTGARGRQFAKLEEIYLQELTAAGYTDPLTIDRQAAEYTENLTVPGLKIVLAGVPDLPNMLKAKLANIDRIAPEQTEIWIHAAAADADDYDEWGIPIPEIWADKALIFPEKSCHKALDPAHAAAMSATLAADQDGNFHPEQYAIVLSDPGMCEAFQQEFSAFTAPDGKPLTIYDPAGVPMSKLRLCRLGGKLTAFLRRSNDFSCAAELIREHDFLLRYGAKSRDIIQALDKFSITFVPDELDRALELADTRTVDLPGFAGLRETFHDLARWREVFAELSVPEFLREFFRTIYAPAEGIDHETICGVPFYAECSSFRDMLAELDRLPPELTETGSKSQVLEIFFRHCSSGNVPAACGEYAYALEGCLEIPFLDAPKVIFCGMNEKFFPDRLDITPYLTDTIRRNAKLRSNRDTAARARCHLHSLLACRPAGNVDFIVLRKDQENNRLRPSRLLFAGKDLPDEVLVKRCAALFSDPGMPPEKISGGKKVFRFAPRLSYKSDEASGLPLLSPTDLDDYLISPFKFYLQRVKNISVDDYLQEEPDERITGTLYHSVFEALGVATYRSAQEYEHKMTALLDQVLNRKFGAPPHPVLIRLLAENMRQRLKFAAGILYEEQVSGFQPVALEYQLNNVALCGAVFRGRIDRIEYSQAENTFRVLDFKTGRVDDVVADHCVIRDGEVMFKKLQLPLYALLLRADEEFRARFPEIDEAKIECGYIHLPQSVTESSIRIWKADELAEVLPAALQTTAGIVAEILAMPEQKLFENPDRFCQSGSKNSFKPFFGSGLRQAVTGVQWEYEEPPVVEAAAPRAAKKKKPSAKESIPPEVITPVSPALETRCCSCPEQIRRNCTCFHGSCADCREFNGFKSLHIITASAGTGKTYRLASRFIQLLMFDADPAQIMAVTFTKKAAGEIFDKIISRLLDLAGNDCSCRQRQRENFILILRKLLNSEKELQISTIDSFFMQLVKVYAPELGIWGEINMIDQQDSRLLRRTFRQWVRSITDPAKLELLRELLKDANNDEDKNFARSMLALLHDVYPYYLLKVRQEPDGTMPQVRFSPWIPQSADLIRNDELADVCAGLQGIADDFAVREQLCTNGSEQKSWKKCVRQLRALAEFLPKTLTGFGRMDDEVQKFFKGLGDYNAPGWSGEDGEIFFTGKLSFPADYAALLRRAFRHIRVVMYLRSHDKTAAVFELMREFDAVYSREVRSAGNLAFSDLPHLLCHSDPDTYGAILGPQDRSLEKRLDAEIHHYMFDEFQDTSDIQWRAFDGLTGELFSAVPEKFKSFFCVGDIKQSIYQWRDGNPGLFRYLLAKAAPAAAEQGYSPLDSLYRSYRSCQAVLDTVNFVFAPGYSGNLPDFAEVVKKMEFTAHIAAKSEMEGFAALVEFDKGSDRDTLQAAAKAGLILETLREIRPFDKGLTVAVLVQKNNTAETFAEELRALAREKKMDLPVSAEGRITVSESMAFAVFRAMLTLAVHPGDKLAREFLESATFDLPGSTPQPLTMAGLAAQMKYDTADLAAGVAEEIFRDGIAAVAERFERCFGAEMTAFDRKRMEYTRAAASGFSGSVDEFLERINHISDSGGTLDQTVQVMTYHKSKGLEFDIVFMPDTGLARRGSNSLLPEAQFTEMAVGYGDAMPESQWISYLPPAGIAGEILEFARHAEMKKSSQAFERCCGLYVAMTRAVRALYIFVSPGGDSKSLALDQLICQRLAPHRMQLRDQEWFGALQERSGFGDRLTLHYSCGRESWHGLIPDKTPEESAEKADFVPHDALFEHKPETVHRASDEKKSGEFLPEQRFAVSGGTAVGTLVHEMFEKLERIDKTWDMEKFCGQFPDDSGFSGAAKAIFRNALAEPSEISAMLRNVPPDAEVWCEKRFLLKNRYGEIVPGAFDRVVIFRKNGVPVRAEIYDWKSDDLAAPENFSIYAGQLHSYRESLAQLLNIPESAVTTFICALKLKKVIPVE